MTVSGDLVALALHLHHHFRGPPVDYGALAAAAAASWAGLPGPGEPVLIAAAIFASRGRLDLASVLAAAWAGAAAGGVVGWLVGLRLGRSVITAPGPLLGLRRRAVARGDEVFARMPVLGVLLAPSWIAGIHGVRRGLFLPVNALGAVFWAVGIGLGAYFAGPPVIDVVDDLGWVLGGALVVLVVTAFLAGVRQRRRREARRKQAEPTQPAGL